jgi:DNA polymerase-3 subunit chi
MTRIDFYLNARSKLQTACQISAKAVRQRMRVLIMAPDDQVARAVDKLMWMNPAIGFLPHCMTSDPLAAETPVLIARNTDAHPHDDLLVNLGLQPPPTFSRFKRLIEIVSLDDETDKQAARERFRFYKDRGYDLRHHDLGATAGE